MKCDVFIDYGGGKKKKHLQQMKEIHYKVHFIMQSLLEMHINAEKKKFHTTKPRFIYFLHNISTHYEQVCVLNT